MESRDFRTITISENPESPRTYTIINIEKPENSCYVVIGESEEEKVSIHNLQTILSSCIDSQIQITQTFLTNNLQPEKVLSYYKYLQPLYFILKTQISIAIDSYFHKPQAFKIHLSNLVNGSTLFKEIQDITNIKMKDFYLILKQKDRSLRLSRNNPEIELELDKSTVMSVKPVRRGAIEIYVQQLLSNDISFKIAEETTVAELKEMIDIEYSKPCDVMKLMFEGSTLKDDEVLKKVGVRQGSKLRLFENNRVIYESNGPTNFVDISKDENAIIIQFSKTADNWRIAEPGLCLEGKCSNKECKAFGKYVIMNSGFGVVDVIRDIMEYRCPMCNKIVAFDRFAFNNCIYEIIGSKLEDGERVHVRTKPNKVGNEYKIFDPTEKNKVVWGILQIITTKISDPLEYCLVCKKSLEAGEGFTFECKHKVHSNCKKLTPHCFNCAPLKQQKK